MTVRYILVGITCFVTGVVCGFYLLGNWKDANNMTAVLDASVSSLADLESSDAVATKDSDRGSEQDESSTNSPASESLGYSEEPALQALSGLGERQEHGSLVVIPAGLISTISQAVQVRTLDQDLFSEGSDLVEYLQLDESEQARLQSNWQELREQVHELEKAAANIEEMPDGSLEIILPDLSPKITELGAKFHTAAAETLGANRAEVFIAAAQIDRVVGDLGSGDRKWIVRAEETGDGGWRYHTIAEGAGGKRTYVGENVPAALLHLTGELQMAAVEE